MTGYKGAEAMDQQDRYPLERTTDQDASKEHLAISDEDANRVKPFIEERKFSYPILLDPGRKVNEAFRVFGIPKSFLYGRNGRLVAQAIDMRTQRQFLEMLGLAGLE